jgi:hypothetical protein
VLAASGATGFFYHLREINTMVTREKGEKLRAALVTLPFVAALALVAILSPLHTG